MYLTFWYKRNNLQQRYYAVNTAAACHGVNLAGVCMSGNKAHDNRCFFCLKQALVHTTAQLEYLQDWMLCGQDAVQSRQYMAQNLLCIQYEGLKEGWGAQAVRGT